MTEIKPTAEQNTAPLRIAFAKPLTPSNKTGDKTQELEELIKVFLSPDAFTIVEEGSGQTDLLVPYDQDGNVRKRFLLFLLSRK